MNRAKLKVLYLRSNGEVITEKFFGNRRTTRTELINRILHRRGRPIAVKSVGGWWIYLHPSKDAVAKFPDKDAAVMFLALRGDT
jgi:hypothetical protein